MNSLRTCGTYRDDERMKTALAGEPSLEDDARRAMLQRLATGLAVIAEPDNITGHAAGRTSVTVATTGHGSSATRACPAVHRAVRALAPPVRGVLGARLSGNVSARLTRLALLERAARVTAQPARVNAHALKAALAYVLLGGHDRIFAVQRMAALVGAPRVEVAAGNPTADRARLHADAVGCLSRSEETVAAGGGHPTTRNAKSAPEREAQGACGNGRAQCCTMTGARQLRLRRVRKRHMSRPSTGIQRTCRTGSACTRRRRLTPRGVHFQPGVERLTAQLVSALTALRPHRFPRRVARRLSALQGHRLTATAGDAVDLLPLLHDLA